MSNGTLVAEYPYRAADGTILATKQRYAPKDFRWTVPLAGGGTASGLNGLKQSDLPLFRLPELLAAPLDTPVLLVEGEKDALTLAGLGFVATTLPEGAGVKHIPHLRLEVLRHRRVYIFADNDEAGRAFRERLVEALGTVVSWLYAPDLPNLPPKGDVTDWVNAGGTADELRAIMDAAAPCGGNGEDTPDPIPDGAQLADDVFHAIRRFVVLSDDAARALTLWVLHCHAFAAAEFTPYIQITSPTRESGKTTLIDVLEALVPDPLRADSATAAAVYRSVDRGRGAGKDNGRPPVLFLDELDAVFGSGGGKSDKAEAIRGVLNSGFRSTGKTLVCDGDANEPRAFVTFCPKVLAAIGACIPDTVTSRSIPIPLARATREELTRLQPARARALRDLSDRIGKQIATWAASALPSLQRRREPVLGLKARHDDVWGPLLNIAEELGGTWPQQARDTARALHADTGDTTDGRDPGIALLADLRDLFDSDGAAYITSARVVELLRSTEGRPWAEYRNGQPITVHGVARLLRPFAIQPRQDRIGYEKVRAYFATDCREAFRRYLPVPPDATGTIGTVTAPQRENGCPNLPTAIGTHPAPSHDIGGVVPVVPLAPITAEGMPPSWDPDPEGLAPLPF
jgi:hypothetical protein